MEISIQANCYWVHLQFWAHGNFHTGKMLLGSYVYIHGNFHRGKLLFFGVGDPTTATSRVSSKEGGAGEASPPPPPPNSQLPPPPPQTDSNPPPPPPQDIANNDNYEVYLPSPWPYGHVCQFTRPHLIDALQILGLDPFEKAGAQ